MSGLLMGYARVSTEEQDLTAQRDALAACRSGATLVVAKLDQLARSLPDARVIAEDLTNQQVKLSLGGTVYDPTDPVGRLLFNVLAMVAEFEADLIRARTREGMRVAKAKRHLRGKQPKLNPRQEAHLTELLRTGEYSIGDVADLFGIGRATVYRAVRRARTSPAIQQPATPDRLAPSPAGRHRLPRDVKQQPRRPRPASEHRPRHLSPDPSDEINGG